MRHVTLFGLMELLLRDMKFMPLQEYRFMRRAGIAVAIVGALAMYGGAILAGALAFGIGCTLALLGLVGGWWNDEEDQRSI